MPAAKRRRSAKDLGQAKREEEDLVASLFGGKRTRRDQGVDHSDGGEDDEPQGSSSFRVNAEQYLDDDKLFMIDTGGDQDDQAEQNSTLSNDDDSEEDSAAFDSDDDSENDDGTEVSSDIDDATDQTKSTQTSRRRPVWTDPSVSNLRISLAGAGTKSAYGSRIGTAKLRKLREVEGETYITGAEYEVRLRKMFESLHPRPSWASLELRKHDAAVATIEGGREALTDLLSSDSGLVSHVNKREKKSRGRLPQSRLEVERLRNANEAQGRALLSPVESLAFHPTTRAHVLMTTTKDRRLRLFQVDGSTNPLLETLHIPDLPLRLALFHPSGSSILLSGPRPFFYSHDLESGKTIKSTPCRGFGSSALGAEEKNLSNVCFQKTERRDKSLLALGGRRGAIHLLDWGTVGGSGGGSLVGSLHMNAPMAGLTWNPSKSHSLVSISTQGTIHSWDVRNMKCEVQRKDAGLFAPNSIKGSPDGEWWAVGSENGMVSIYGKEVLDASRSDSSTIHPHKSIKNITMTTSSLNFNHTGEALAIATDKKKDALKVAHLPSLTVFENWPTAGTPLGRVTSLEFSNSSEYLAIGNTRGKVLLYSLRHFI